MQKAVIGVLENGSSIEDKFGRSLTRCYYALRRLTPSSQFCDQLTDNACDVLLASDPLTHMAVGDVLTRLHTYALNIPVIFVATQGSIRNAVDAIHQGASDYLLMSDDSMVLLKSIERVLKLQGVKASEPGTAAPGIVSASPVMRQLLDMAARIAPSAATVLIQGESGTGKEMLAKYIHARSERAHNGFFAMNCAALPDNLAESELFGYERGAFTGAVQRKPGKFELAHNGTLLLDEISEMPLALQAKLLRVLQEKEVDRVGGSKTIAVDVRVIATTNRDLGRMVDEGFFRKDLFYRLRVIPMTLPALTARKEDIPLLVEHFIEKYRQPNEPLPEFTQEALERMKNWHWPGNVRELENAVERALLIRNGPRMGPELLMLDEFVSADQAQNTAELVGLTVKELEERLIRQTLRHVNQNRTHAAEMLGISIRTLRNKLREYREGGEEEAIQ